jgi:hypothetical protein
MCCLFATLVVFGPRLGILVWWLFQPLRFQATFNTFIWPFLGFLFLPWTTIMYLAVYGFNGIIGFDWIWLGLGLLADIASYSSAYRERRSVPYYPG